MIKLPSCRTSKKCKLNLYPTLKYHLLIACLSNSLQKACENKDPLVAAWAIENEEFQRLVARADPAKCPEERQLQKLLMKTAKEIHKLRKTKVPKGCPDLVSFK